MSAIAVVSMLLTLGAFAEDHLCVTPEVAPSSARGVVQVECEWTRAANAPDPEKLRIIFVDDATIIGGSGQLKTKSAEIQDLTTAPSDNYRPGKPLTITHMQVRAYGNTAVVTGLISWSFHSGGREVEQERRYMHVCVKRRSGWQIVAQQVGPNQKQPR